jgi:hypothetical protein
MRLPGREFSDALCLLRLISREGTDGSLTGRGTFICFFRQMKVLLAGRQELTLSSNRVTNAGLVMRRT